MTAIEIRNLTKTFGKSRKALDDVTLSFRQGEMVALIGASGSGKSTLIRHIAGLVTADRGTGQGEIRVLGETVQSGGTLARGVRRSRAKVGVVFQQFNLIGRLSLLTNVVAGVLGRIPAWRGCFGRFTRSERLAAMEALHRVGIAGHAAQRASTLSGGQQQRAAIARALVQRAEIILADEPIASLDPVSARRVMDLLAQVNREDGITVLVSLHQVDYALHYCCDRVVALRDGRVVYDGPATALTPEFLQELYGSQSEDLMLPAALGPSRSRKARIPQTAAVEPALA